MHWQDARDDIVLTVISVKKKVSIFHIAGPTSVFFYERGYKTPREALPMISDAFLNQAQAGP
jgi:hypothetical protein